MRTGASGSAFDGALVEASLPNEAKASANSVRLIVVLLKQRRRDGEYDADSAARLSGLSQMEIWRRCPPYPVFK